MSINLSEIDDAVFNAEYARRLKIETDKAKADQIKRNLDSDERTAFIINNRKRLLKGTAHRYLNKCTDEEPYIVENDEGHLSRNSCPRCILLHADDIDLANVHLSITLSVEIL